MECDGGPEIAVDEGGIHAVEALILARYYMYLQVYHHRTRRLFDHYLATFCRQVLPPFDETDLARVVEFDDYVVTSKIREYAQSSEPSEIETYARQLWYRGGDDLKHSVVYQTDEFAGIRWVKNISRKVDESSARYQEHDLFVDTGAKGKIHGFYADEEQDHEGEVLRVVAGTGRQRRLPLITQESRIIRSIPTQFWIARVYAKGTRNCLKEIEDHLRDLRKD